MDYKTFKGRIKRNITSLNMIGELGAVIMDLFDKHEVNASAFNDTIIIKTYSYSEAKQAMEDFSNILPCEFNANRSWYGCNSYLFSWEAHNYPVEVWVSFDIDKIPEELKGDCEIQEVQKTDYVLACRSGK